MIKDINNINNENNINHKFYKINNIYNLLNDKVNEITAIYKVNDEKNKIRIFGSDFVKNNKDKCKIIYENEIYDLTEYFNIKPKNDNLRIILKGIRNITNMSYIFSKCSSLLSLPDISLWNTSKVTDMNNMFNGCSSLLSLPDFLILDASKVLI